MTSSIRMIGSDEVGKIRDLAYQTWPETFREILSEEQIEYMLEWMYNVDSLKTQIFNDHLFFIAKDEEKHIGFLGIQPGFPSPAELKIHKLYVLPKFQGAGIGKALIQKAFDVAIETGKKKVVLNVNRFNRAVEFYKNLGFVIEKEENIDIGNGYLMEDYVMSIDL